MYRYLPNILSSTRFLLAFALLSPHIHIRIGAIIVAMATDALDGFIARRFSFSSHFGAIIDPLADKFFVLFALILLLQKGDIHSWQAMTMLTRDFSVLAFAIYIFFSGKKDLYECGSIWWGKISTTMQLLLLIGIHLGYHFPWIIYTFFIFFGVMAFVELLQRKKEAFSV